MSSEQFLHYRANVNLSNYLPTIEHTEAKLIRESPGLEPLLQLQCQLVLTIHRL